ncbi:MAG: tRNA pseudouridine(38-40) synthase TruA [Prevotellaceae bacterium]|jgi:tRNA pseudouridine38-40 synthase|nr:tRNA pseudouridine(38-40) synthase TruA [Prevotellaceae bacterium]
MARYFLQLSYDGSDFHGWQIQHNANTVQATLDNALTVCFCQKIETTGAGRTDTGVHASFFVAHFDCSDENLEQNQSLYLYRLNSILPKSIAVKKIKKVHDDANARFDAVSRTYCYYMHRDKNPFNILYSALLTGNVDIDLMNKAANKLFDYTDFTSFSKLHTDVKTNNCIITEAVWREENDKLIFTVTANRFLRNMVRSIVGTLLDVGKKRITVDDFCKIIEMKNRCCAGKSVAAKGLFLTDIKYPYDIG